MHKNNRVKINNECAVSQIVGAVLLVAIAVIVFVAIYNYVFPLPLPQSEPNVKLVGYVNENGNVVLEHIGGEAINSYEIYVNGELAYGKNDEPWEIGERISPTDQFLSDAEDQITVTVYDILDDGSRVLIFDGIITGKTREESQSPAPPTSPMLISSLGTNTVDEDITCYNYSINPDIDASTYIYNWLVNHGSGNQSITNLLMPFDTNSSDNVKDYSGDRHNGTVINASWLDNGKVGGAYSFDGNSYITLPYCFGSSYIDKITVEAWIKTNADSGTIASFNRKKYWELETNEGKITWSTNTDNGTIDTIGNSAVNDNNWHHIAAVYDSSNGTSAIYIDGELDVSENGHDSGENLGNGESPSGFIGRGQSAGRETIFSTSFETQDELDNWKENGTSGGGQEETWDNLRYDDFNSGWGSYTDGGYDCARTSSYKHEGSYSARIRDNSGTASSFYLTNGIDVDSPEYKSIKIDFWWMWNGNGWRSGEDWWVRYYDGNQWRKVLDVDYPSGYSKNVWYHEIFYINETDYNFPTNMKIQFRCDASSNYDRVYIDQVYINATGGDRIDYDFDLRDSSALNPRTGTYSIGGTGDFDPEYAAFNRTEIDISSYNDVKVSVWYSYKDTESADFIGLYYLDGDSWIPIFEDDDPQIGSGQSDWTYVEGNISDSVDTLVLQFRWMTSSTTEYVAIDDLEITGIPPSSGSNFTGLIDEFRIYNRILSPEQIYQNYLCTKDGYSNRSVIVSEETELGDTWKCIVTPNDGIQDGANVESNSLEIIGYAGG